ncbi:MAG: MFS transporter [Novosphingobium sp.]|nr:MFS transporter [Novosphingobium sp.]
MNGSDMPAAADRPDSAGAASRWQVLVLVTAFLAMFVDGYDFYVFSILAPAIAAALKESPQGIGFVFVLQQIGTATGAVVVGLLADRLGYRRTLATCMALIGVLTLATLKVTSLEQMAYMRGLSGLFIGGVVPAMIAMVSETSPTAVRGRMMTIAFLGYVLGYSGASVVGGWLLGDFGWHIAFWIGGFAPFVLVPMILLLVPANYSHLLHQARSSPRAAQQLQRFFSHIESAPAPLEPASPGASRPTVLGDLLRGRLLVLTPLLWVVFFCSLGGLLLISIWLPTLFIELGGIPTERYSRIAIFNSLGGVVGTLLIGVLLDRFGARIVLPAFALGTAGALALLGATPFGSVLSIAALTGVGLMISGTQSGIGAFAALLYPHAIRSTGTGAAFTAGRIGGIVLPMVGGAILAARLPLDQAMLIMGIPAVCAAALLAVLCRERI